MDELDLDACVAAIEQVARWDWDLLRREIRTRIRAIGVASLETTLVACMTSSKLRHRVAAMCIFGLDGSAMILDTAESLDPTYWFVHWSKGEESSQVRGRTHNGHTNEYFARAFTLNPTIDLCFYLIDAVGFGGCSIPGLSVNAETQHNGRQSTYTPDKVGKYELLLRANELDPTNTHVYMMLYDLMRVRLATYIFLTDGGQMTYLDLCVRVIGLDSTHVQAWKRLWHCLDFRADGWVPPGIPARSLMDVGLRALADYDSRIMPSREDARILSYMRAHMKESPHTSTWSRHTHSTLWAMTPYVRGNPICATYTTRLFTTLLLGIRRLELTGVLVPSHDSMLEDMLECWTWHDHEHSIRDD